VPRKLSPGGKGVPHQVSPLSKGSNPVLSLSHPVKREGVLRAPRTWTQYGAKRQQLENFERLSPEKWLKPGPHSRPDWLICSEFALSLSLSCSLSLSLSLAHPASLCLALSLPLHYLRRCQAAAARMRLNGLIVPNLLERQWLLACAPDFCSNSEVNRLNSNVQR